jgi:hypothetical protein
MPPLQVDFLKGEFCMPLFALPFMMGPAFLLFIPFVFLLLLISPVFLLLNATGVSGLDAGNWLVGVLDWLTATFNITL